MKQQLIIEAIIVGISVVFFGTILSFMLGRFLKVDLPPVCKNWNKNYAMEIILFATGVAAHLFYEYSGINKWYCKKGNACKM